MSDQEASNNLSSAFAVRGNDALEEQYDEWVETYDADNAAMGFRLPVLASAFFARWVPTGGKVLDAGCGIVIWLSNSLLRIVSLKRCVTGEFPKQINREVLSGYQR